MMRVQVVWLGLIAFCSVTGCQSPAGPGAIGTGPVKIVATTSIIADAVKQVGGVHVDVKTLMPAGTDPHNYLPASGDSETLSQAHIVFFNGLHLEGKMTQLLEENRNVGTRSVAVSHKLDHKADVRHVDGDTAEDPHIWFDVRLWMKCVEAIRDELISINPAHAAEYRANTERYLAELQALDAEVREKANTISSTRRILVTSHDAFGYFARAYGFEVRGLQGVSTSFTTSTKDVEELANFIGQRGITAIFCETSVRPKGLEKVLDTVKSRYKRDVYLVGGTDALYSDSLGEPGTPGETYIGTVRHNIDTLVKHLR